MESEVMVRIVVPIDPRLHAHAKGHWREKAEATKTARNLAKLLAKTGIGNRKITGKAIVSYTFIVPDRLRRDIANMIQSCKPYVDGVVDAKMIDGDHWEALDMDKPNVILGPKLEAIIEFRKA